MRGERSETAQQDMATGDGGQPACPACGSARVGKFCAECGHAVHYQRRTVWMLLQDLVDNLINWDFKTLNSVLALIGMPGAISRDAAEGRGRFVTPVKLFFAVLVFFTLFYALSPYKFAQVYISTAAEVEDVTGYSIAPDAAPYPALNMLFFAPETDSVTTDGVKDVLANNDPDYLLSVDERWIEPLQVSTSASADAKFARQTTVIMSYIPLCVIIPMLIVNGLIYRRRRYIMDHVLTSFETASLLPVLVIAVTLVVAIADQAGTQLWVIPPRTGLFEFVLMPAFVIGLAAIDRRFYRTPWLWLFPKAILIAVLWVPCAAFSSLWAMQYVIANGA